VPRTNPTNYDTRVVLLVHEAAERIGDISIRRVRDLCADGCLPCFKLGGLYYIDRPGLERSLTASGDVVADVSEDWRIPLTLTVRSTAKMLGAPERRVRDLISRGTLPAVRLGDRLHVLRRPLQRLMMT